MLKIICIGLGGGVGAICRYGLTSFVNGFYMGNFPLGTLIVNFFGALCMGAVTQWFAQSQITASYWLPFLTTGLLGGFTTFSTFSLETANLLEQGDWTLAAINITASLCMCILGIFLGKYLIKCFF